MAFSAALSGLNTAQKRTELASSNIANADTTGFKEQMMQTASVASGNITGSGVTITGVSPDFSQGSIDASTSNLHLAVDGEGFFVLQDSKGQRTYSRAGAFQVDKNGSIVNNTNQNVIGYTADSTGNITGAEGSLKVNLPILPPVSTTTVAANLNFDPSKNIPITPFVSGFTPSNPPAASSYNHESIIEVYDSLGVSHTMISYFVKAPVLNTWYVHIGIDGIDVTPTTATPPNGASANLPVSYASGSQAQPFTVVFDNKGNYVLNNPSVTPLYYGDIPPVSSQLITNKGSLPTLGPLDLTLNGKPITVAQTIDTYSYSDNSASAMNIAAAINQSSKLNSVTATANQTTYDLGTAPVGAPFTLNPGNLVINGVDMAGVYANAAALVTNINTLPLKVPNINAQIDGAGNFILYNSSSVTNGMNITVETNGTGPAGGNFGGFAIDAGAAQKVVRGSITLTPGNQTITPNTLNLGVLATAGAGTLSAGELVVDGVDLAGAYTTPTQLVNYINTGNVAGLGFNPPIPNVTASLVGGELILTDVYGRDISVTTLGTEAAGNVSLAKLNIVTPAGPGSAFSKGTLSEIQPIVIGGNNPGNMGFIAGPRYGTIQANSDPMQVSFNPNDGSINPQTIKIDYTLSTQFQANYAERSLDQDGYTTGRLINNGITIDDSGLVSANYDNNQSLVLGQIVLARFANPNGLQDIGNTSYMPTGESGLALISAPKSSSLGSVMSKNLESSNVDLTQQLVELIKSQAAFGANAQSLRAEDTIIQTMISLR